MRKIALVVLAVCAGVTAQPASADKAGLCTRAYVARVKVINRIGSHAAGRNICRFGIKPTSKMRDAGVKDSREATVKEKYLYLTQLRNLAKPAPPFLWKKATLPLRPPAGVMSWTYIPTGVAACIVHNESRGNPQAQNGQYLGLAQWSPEAWGRMGGHRYASTPLGATEQQQLVVLSNGLTRYGCHDWCPFDGC